MLASGGIDDEKIRGRRHVWPCKWKLHPLSSLSFGGEGIWVLHVTQALEPSKPVLYVQSNTDLSVSSRPLVNLVRRSHVEFIPFVL